MKVMNRILQAAILFVYFVKEFVKSCLLVARDCLRTSPRLAPVIVTMPLESRNPGEIFLLANMITLTPGTMTLDVAEDLSSLTIHTIYGEDPEAVVADLKSGMEAMVRKVFQ